jgi:hypothetical protein
VKKYKPTTLEKVIYPEINLNMYISNETSKQTPKKQGQAPNLSPSRVQHFKKKQSIKINKQPQMQVNTENDRNTFQREMDNIEPKSPMLQMWLDN